MTLKQSEERQDFLIQKDQENIRLMLITIGLQIIIKECLQWQQEQEKQLHHSIAY